MGKAYDGQTQPDQQHGREQQDLHAAAHFQPAAIDCIDGDCQHRANDQNRCMDRFAGQCIERAAIDSGKDACQQAAGGCNIERQ